MSYQLITPSLSLDLEKGLDAYFKERDGEKKVTCGIPTRNRYEVLQNTLLSIIYQTVKPNQLIIVDDSDIRPDLREKEAFKSIFLLLNYYNIEWEIIYGRRMGQVHSHQIVQEIAKYPIIWRIDDDEIAEPNVLETLLSHWASDVGAVGGLVPQDCPMRPLPSIAANDIKDLNKPNIQWFKHNITDVIEVDHLTSSYIYRKGLVNFETTLSAASFREETLHTHEIKRKGYKLLVDPSVITWHFRAPNRHENVDDWHRDDLHFQSKLKEWGINTESRKICILDFGMGDTLIFLKILPDLIKKYKKLIIADCYPVIFKDYLNHSNIEFISIAEAQRRFGNLDKWNLYKFCIDNSWDKSLEKALRKLYDI